MTRANRIGERTKSTALFVIKTSISIWFLYAAGLSVLIWHEIEKGIGPFVFLYLAMQIPALAALWIRRPRLIRWGAICLTFYSA